MSAPKRIQRKRTKGWRMPESAVYVGRPSKWGNPYRWTEYARIPLDDGAAIPAARRRSWAVNDFRAAMDPEFGFRVGQYPDKEAIRRELAGRDLACWCPLDQPCHADVLLEIANSTSQCSDCRTELGYGTCDVCKCLADEDAARAAERGAS